MHEPTYPLSHARAVTGRKLLVVSAGHTYPEISQRLGDFDQWIVAGIAQDETVDRFDAHSDRAYPDLRTVKGVIVSGSHAMVTDREAWSERLASWLQACMDARVPILGICYGHQLVVDALGGTVGQRSAGIEIGTQSIEATDQALDDPLFDCLPARFPAQTVHYQYAIRLPEKATMLAVGPDGLCQAFRHGPRTWGVQFHPEFSSEAMTAYLDILSDRLAKDGLDPTAIKGDIQPTPEATDLLHRFAVFCDSKSICYTSDCRS